jgi:hypothetical protein
LQPDALGALPGLAQLGRSATAATRRRHSAQQHNIKTTNMKLTKCTSLALLTLFFVSVQHLFGVTGTRLAIQGTDVVLRWPSRPGEIFIIGYRPTLDPATPWTFLETSYDADPTGTETTYVHQNVVVFPAAAPGGGEGGGGGTPPSPSSTQATASYSTMTEEERAARRQALYKRAQAMAEHLMAMLKEAVAKAEADRERWKKEGRPTMQGSVSAAEAAADSPPVGSMGFYFVAELGEDVDGDLLPNDWELLLGTSILKADSDGDSIDDGMEDFDGDGRSNYHEIVAGTDPLVADELITHTFLTSGAAIREEFEVELSVPSGLAAAATTSIDTELAVYGNDNDGIGGMYTRVPTEQGTVRVSFYSIFIEGSFEAAALEPAAEFGLSNEELRQLGDAYGHGTRSRSGIFSTPNQSMLQQIPTETLEKAAELHAAKAKEFWIKANDPGITATQRRIFIDQVDTQVSRYNAVRRAVGRTGQALLPLAIIGGVMVAIDVYGSQQALIDAAIAYHAAAVNGDDLCDPAIDVAIWANNVAPPSFNFVWDYLCP